MKIVAIILVVAIIGFALYKLVIEKKSKSKQTTAKPSSRPSTGTSTPSQSDYYSGKR